MLAPVGQPSPSSHGHRSELHLTNNVPERKYGGAARLLTFVDRDVPTRLELNGGRQVRRQARPTADRRHNDIKATENLHNTVLNEGKHQ